MRRKKYMAGAILLILLAEIFTGCGGTSQETTPKSIKVGVTVYDQYDTFVSQLMESFHRYAGKKEEETGIAINIEVYNAADSQTTQNSQVEKMINDGCQVVCVNLVDRTEPTTIIDMAEKNNVPVIFFNRELVEEDLERWEWLYYVGAKAFESGIMEGELAVKEWQEHPEADKNGDGIFQYMVLEGEAGHQDAIVRTEYAVSTIVEQGIEVEKLGYAIANWNRAQAQTKMAQMLTEYGEEIELVIANNDDMALGAIDALKAEGIGQEQWPVIVGIDGTDVGLEAVRNGELAGTVYNDKEGQAKAMLELAYQLSTGGSLKNLELEKGKYIRLPYAKIGPDEVKNYEFSEEKSIEER
ncbi:MAG: galactose ABC transporter substrate-binding protein [Lachnospiraceae bacterium]|nr:galactose ABC transporter substrate-binding protein [Lachnospiraceae bacterium]